MNAKEIKRIASAWAEVMRENQTFLVELDSVAGDGDIGMVLSDGFAAVDRALQDTEEEDIGKLVYRIGRTLAAEAPSSMGTLLASGFMQAGKALRGNTEFGISDLIKLMEEIGEGIMVLGGAVEGEKTSLDSLLPGLRAMREHASAPLGDALLAAEKAAEQGFENTRNMLAKHGRIAVRGEGSRTIADPGAAAVMLLYRGLRLALAGAETRET